MGDAVLLAFDGYCLDVAQGSIRDRQGREFGASPRRASTCCTTSFGTPAGSSRGTS